VDPEIRRFLTEALVSLRQTVEPQVLVFFGSRVGGRPDEWSDIDLIVVSPKFEGMRLLARMDWFLEVTQPHIGVDALCYTPEEFDYMMAQPSLVREAVQTGLRVI
jgi:predicted nucleotidyltransferase